MSIISDTDVRFAHEFYAQEYGNAFRVNPENISEKMLKSVGKHMLVLGEQTSDAGTEELTEILNALLYADPQHCPKYSNGSSGVMVGKNHPQHQCLR